MDVHFTGFLFDFFGLILADAKAALFRRTPRDRRKRAAFAFDSGCLFRRCLWLFVEKEWLCLFLAEENQFHMIAAAVTFKRNLL